MKMKLVVLSLCALSSFTASALTMQEAINEAINSHPDILAAKNEQLAVNEEVSRARAGYLPTVNVSLGKGWEESNNTTTRNNAIINNVSEDLGLNRDEASIQVRQMLFDGMATKNEVERQAERHASRTHRVISESERIALETVRVYTDVLRRQKLVKLAEDNYLAHETTHEQIKMRGDFGVGRRSDMIQSEGRLALAKTNLLSEMSNLKDAEVAFVRVVGQQPENLTEPLLDGIAFPESIEDILSHANMHHPALKVANADVSSATAQNAASSAPFFPRFDLELSATSNNNIDGVRGSNQDMSAMLRMQYNLYNGGADKARKQETAYLLSQASEIRNDTIRQIEEEARFAWNALQTLNEQMAFFELHVSSSEETLEAYLQQFSLGQRTLLDLLDSKNELLVSSQALVNAKYDTVYTSYRVLNSIGDLLPSVSGITPTDASN